MKAKFSVDRIEEGKYVLVSDIDPSHVVVWPTGAMPVELHEGDIVSFDLTVDEGGKKEAEEKVMRLIDELLDRPMPEGGTESAKRPKAEGKK